MEVPDSHRRDRNQPQRRRSSPSPRPLPASREQTRLAQLRLTQLRLTQLRPTPKIPLTSVPITYTSGEQLPVYRFTLPVTVGVPLLALFLQAFLPRHFPGLAVYLDFALLVTILHAKARRKPISGLLTGAVIGLFQDMLGHNPIGIYGIAKTVVGYLASSLGVKLDVENAGARFLLTLGFYFIHSAVWFTVARGMVSLTQNWSWSRGLLAGLANAFLGVILYFFLDKFKQRA